MKLIILRTFSRRRGDGSTVTYRRGGRITISCLSTPVLQLINEGYLARDTKKFSATLKNIQEAAADGEEKSEQGTTAPD